MRLRYLPDGLNTDTPLAYSERNLAEGAGNKGESTMDFRNMRVATRLALAFGIVLLAMTVAALLTMTRLANIQANLEDMVLDNNVKIKLNYDLETDAHVVSRVVRSVVLLPEKAEKERNLIQMLRDRQVDGLIISTTLENNRDIQELLDDNFPTVLVDRFIPNFKAPFVTADNFQGAFDAVEHLIANGAKNIGLLTISPSHLTSMTERTRGYREALEKNKIGFDNALVREIPYDNIRAGIQQHVPELLSGKKTVDALFLLKKSIPSEVAVVSFDDIEMFRFIHQGITAVAQPVEEMGRVAVDVILDKILNGEDALMEDKVFLKTQLIVRSSSQKAKTKA